MIKRDLQHTDPRHPESGAVLVLVAISIVALVGVAALAVDLGYLMVTRNEVQNIADGASLAGARQLGAIYQGLPHSEQQNYVCDGTCQDSVRGAAQDVALKNRAGGVDMTVDVEDIRIGRWDVETDIFKPTYTKPNAVHVVARRDEETNDPVSTFFARVLGIDEVPVNADAIAAMTGQGSVVAGELTIPVAIDEWYFEDDDRCNDHIRFNPTTTSCAGWTTWDLGHTPPNLKKILTGNHESPELIAYEDLIQMTGGNLAQSVFPEMLMLFQYEGCATTGEADWQKRKYLAPGGGLSSDGTDCVGWKEVMDHPLRAPWPDGVNQEFYPDPNKTQQDDPTAPRFYHMWDTTVPVYESYGCGNPSNELVVVGFAQVIITNVTGRSTQQIDGQVICDIISPENNRGGGGEFGIIGPIPGLVR